MQVIEAWVSFCQKWWIGHPEIRRTWQKIVGGRTKKGSMVHHSRKAEMPDRFAIDNGL